MTRIMISLFVTLTFSGCRGDAEQEPTEKAKRESILSEQSRNEDKEHVSKFDKDSVYKFFAQNHAYSEVVDHFGAPYESDPPMEGVTTSYFCSGDPDEFTKFGPDKIGIYFLVQHDELGEVTWWAPTWIGGTYTPGL